ncbi:protein RRP5 homolog isoform X2 [Corticium candelabrum]|uniref:protein RRP5 homolog isoform X2 n=1 Tax=Corticium candelabrum TaxID=121492 RepID=UPI002E26B4F9|nr:protein RRP5 homolog isoform X2 [Corticium candelabrum]
MAGKEFPRGGKHLLTPLEVRSVREQAERDVLFGGESTNAFSHSEEVAEKKDLRKSSGRKRKLGAAESPQQVKRSRKHGDTLSFKKLQVGCLLLGAVREVGEHDVTVSLPAGLSGFIHASDISTTFSDRLQQARDKAATVEQINDKDDDNDEEIEDDVPNFSDILNVGSLVRCYVQNIKSSPNKHHRIQLSTEPGLVNSMLKSSCVQEGLVLSGCVTSVEEHGYIMSFGIEGRNGFLQNRHAKKYIKDKNGGKPLCVGQVVDCCVLSFEPCELKTVPVTVNSDEVNKTVMTAKMMLSMTMLTPGMLVNATITEVFVDGLAVSFLGGFTGFVSNDHLSGGHISTDCYKQSQKLKARIMYINFATKTVGLSLKKSIVENKPETFEELSVGDIVEEAVVLRISSDVGLLMQLNEFHKGFVHISRVSDNHTEKLQAKKYKVNSTHRCRILGFNTFDGLATLSMQKSVLEKAFLRYADIAVGSVITGIVQSIESSGVLVSITDHICGLCPLMHLADVKLKNPERKFKEKKMMKFRVLEVNPSRHKLILTHKKTLLRSQLPTLACKEDAVIGGIYHGTIVSVRHYGCIVAFYGDVKGLLHKTEIGSHTIEDPAKVFYIGQVVQCRIISMDYGKLRLSLRGATIMAKTGITSTSAISKALVGSAVDIKAGTIVEAALAGVSAEGLDVVIVPEGIPGFIPAYHLSDHCDHWHPILTSYGQRLEAARGKQEMVKAVVTGKDQGSLLILSMKPILMTPQAIQHAQSLNFSDLKIGFVMAGFIKQIMPFGCFVSFPGRLVGLAPVRDLTDKFLNSPSDAFKVGQSVYAKVTEIETTKHRFLLSLKRTDVQSRKGDPLSAIQHVNSYLLERHVIDDSTLQLQDTASLFSSISWGTVVRGKIISKTAFGLYLELDVSPVKTFVPPGHYDDNLKVKEWVTGVVLDRDCQRRVVDVSLKHGLVSVFGQASTTQESDLFEGGLVDVCIELIKPDYIILSLQGSSSRLLIAPTKAHVNDVLSLLPASQRYSVGDTLKATVEQIPDLASQGIASLPVVSLHPVLMSTAQGANDLKIETIVNAKILSIKDIQMNMEVMQGCHGRVHITEMQDSVQPGDKPFLGYCVSQVVKAVVIGFRNSKSYKYLPISHHNSKHTVVELSLKPSRINTALSEQRNGEKCNMLSPKTYLKDLTEGDAVTGFVYEIDKVGLTVALTPTVRGSVAAVHTSREISVAKKLRRHFCPGQCLSFSVLETMISKKFVELSLIGSLEEIKHLTEVGSVGIGRVVKHIASKGLHVQLPGRKLGLVALTDIGDDYRLISITTIQENALVRYVVLNVNLDHIDLSLRQSHVQSAEGVDPSKLPEVTDREIQSLEDITEGDIIRGFVVSVAQRGGVFIRYSRHLTARAKITNLFDGYFKNWDTHFQIGQVVKMKVLSIDEQSGQVDVSLRLSDVDPVAAAKHRKERALKRKRKLSDTDVLVRKKKPKLSGYGDSGNETGDDEMSKIMSHHAVVMASEKESEDEGDWSSDNDTDVVKSEHGLSFASDKPRLKLSSEFDWSEKSSTTATPLSKAMESSDEEVEEVQETGRKKTKRQKRADKRQDEKKVYQTEQSLLQHGVIPETPDDFDRLLLSSPNSSVLWLQYMAYYLHLTEIDKARGVAERALKTMSFREEKEKLNVWTAFMNLENLYGTEESLLKVFEEALQQNEPVVIFFKLINIYIQSRKFDCVEQLYSQMTKRFSANKDVWVKFGLFRMKQGQIEAARKLLQRSLKVLPKKEHIDVIVKFAQLEFKFGEPERGRTVFESVLSNYPKRVDLWSVYIDMALRVGEPQEVRDLLERVICLTLSTKKMKFFFKRYLEFEQKHGDEDSVTAVKQKAIDYVESKISQT